MVHFKPDNLNHEILKLLFTGSKTSAELYKGIPSGKGFLSLTDFITDVASVLSAEGYITYTDGVWDITSRGASIKSKLEAPERPVGIITPKRDYTVDSRSYSGLELKDTCLRKGAYDFLALPSLYGNTLVPHRTAGLYTS